MSPEDIAALRARLAAATTVAAAPWQGHHGCVYDATDHVFVAECDVIGEAPALLDLIAHAPSDMAALLAHCDALQTLLDAARTACTAAMELRAVAAAERDLLQRRTEELEAAIASGPQCAEHDALEQRVRELEAAQATAHAAGVMAGQQLVVEEHHRHVAALQAALVSERAAGVREGEQRVLAIVRAVGDEAAVDRDREGNSSGDCYRADGAMDACETIVSRARSSSSTDSQGRAPTYGDAHGHPGCHGCQTCWGNDPAMQAALDDPGLGKGDPRVDASARGDGGAKP